MPSDTVTIDRFLDRHLHIRDGKLMKTVLPYSVRQTRGAVIMGNLKHPDETSTIEKAVAYRKRIEACIPEGVQFTTYMTCYLTDEITPEEVAEGFKRGAWCAVKLYIAGQGGTTNSAHGVKNLRGRYKVFDVMEDLGIPLLGHFEAVEEDVDEFDREVVSVDRDLSPILKRFPNLRIVFEHLTDGRSADFVAATSHKVYATVTPHHLMLNRNAMFWGGMNPGHYCKPVPKREEHRRRVRQYVTSGHWRFGAGTDSAPHDESAKSRCYGCAAGIFTAPVALELYATVFDEDNALEHLNGFMSKNFMELYGASESKETLTLVRGETLIPQSVGGVPVFRGGTTLLWKLAD